MTTPSVTALPRLRRRLGLGLLGLSFVLSARVDARRGERHRGRQRPIPRPAAEAPRPGESPTSGTRRIRIRAPRPISIGGAKSAARLSAPRRPSAARMAADDPRRAQARRAARAAYGKRNGPARVARMAAADLGARSDEAARVLARKSSVAVLRRLIRHKESAVRAGVAMALAHRPRLGPALLTELLGDRNLRVIRLAVRSAARLGDRRVVGRLAKLALRYERSIRGAALRVLAHHASIPVARRKLIEAFNHRSAAVREDAVVAVGLGGATWARYWLGRRARDRSSAVRRSVARALGRLPPAASAIRVLRRLSRDRSPRVRKAARRARRELRRARRAAARARRESRRRRLRRRKRGRRAGRPGASAPRRSAP